MRLSTAVLIEAAAAAVPDKIHFNPGQAAFLKVIF